MSRIVDAWSTGVFRRALVEVTIVGILAGAVGAHVLCRRLSFYVVAMSHATFPGIVLGALAGIGIGAGAAAAGLVVTLLIALVSRRDEIGTTTATGIALAGAFAVGLAVQSAGSGGSRQLTAFLIGSPVTVTRADVIATVALAGVALAAIIAMHKELVFTAFDPLGARAAGYRGPLIDLTAMLIVLAVVVVALPSVGALLVTALVVVPPLTARAVTARLVPAIALGALFAALAGVVGLTASTLWPVASGPAVVLTSGIGFLIATAVRTARQMAGNQRQRATGNTVRTSPVGSAP